MIERRIKQARQAAGLTLAASGMRTMENYLESLEAEGLAQVCVALK